VGRKDGPQSQPQWIKCLSSTFPEPVTPDLASHLPGPFAYNIVSHARCPVLAVHDQQAWERTLDLHLDAGYGRGPKASGGGFN